MDEFVKIVVFVPQTHGDSIRKILGENGAGNIGSYEFCSFTLVGTGRFTPLENANPAIGTIGKSETVVEERIETICKKTDIKALVHELKKVHPYEEPVIDIYPLMNNQ